MTLLCKCNWCGNVVEYDSDIKTLKFDDREYHYCKDCVLDVNVALSVGKNGEQGKYKLIWNCWEELHKALELWKNGIKYYRVCVTPDVDLMSAIKIFNEKVDKIVKGVNE